MKLAYVRAARLRDRSRPRVESARALPVNGPHLGALPADLHGEILAGLPLVDRIRLLQTLPKDAYLPALEALAGHDPSCARELRLPGPVGTSFRRLLRTVRNDPPEAARPAETERDLLDPELFAGALQQAIGDEAVVNYLAERWPLLPASARARTRPALEAAIPEASPARRALDAASEALDAIATAAPNAMRLFHCAKDAESLGASPLRDALLIAVRRAGDGTPHVTEWCADRTHRIVNDAARNAEHVALRGAAQRIAEPAQRKRALEALERGSSRITDPELRSSEQRALHLALRRSAAHRTTSA